MHLTLFEVDKFWNMESEFCSLKIFMGQKKNLNITNTAVFWHTCISTCKHNATAKCCLKK